MWVEITQAWIKNLELCSNHSSWKFLCVMLVSQKFNWLLVIILIFSLTENCTGIVEEGGGQKYITKWCTTQLLFLVFPSFQVANYGFFCNITGFFFFFFLMHNAHDCDAAAELRPAVFLSCKRKTLPVFLLLSFLIRFLLIAERTNTTEREGGERGKVITLLSSLVSKALTGLTMTVVGNWSQKPTWIWSSKREVKSPSTLTEMSGPRNAWWLRLAS